MALRDRRTTAAPAIDEAPLGLRPNCHGRGRGPAGTGSGATLRATPTSDPSRCRSPPPASCAPAVPASPSPAPTRASWRRRRASTPTRCSSTSRTRSRRSRSRTPARTSSRRSTPATGATGSAPSGSTTGRPQWTYRDVIEVVEGAGANLDCIMLPKVQTAEQVVALDLLLTQIETTMGYEVGRIGIEAQIENALGLINVDAIATASPRVETIIFGPADFMASINMKSPGGRRAAARVRRRRRLPLHPDADPDGGPGPRQAGDRRSVPADPGRRRLQAGRRPLAPRSASTASGRCTRTRSRPPTRSTPRCRRTTTTPRTSSTPTSTTRPRRAAPRAR